MARLPRSHLLEQLYAKNCSPLEFKWDNLWAPPLLNYLYPEDIQKLNNIATSVRYAAKMDMKQEAIKNILAPRGFKKFHSGTNRVVYQYLEDSSFLIKIALDEVGMGDNPAEFKNQFLLKPFVTKVFDVSPCGTVGSFERITPILNRQEFYSVADDVYNLITKCIIGKYVLNDIGTNSWMNYGIRPGFGVCLLDFPYVYELDGNKIYCNVPIHPGTTYPVCGGEIDYDNGFNYLVCTKCGKKFDPKLLGKDKKDIDNLIIIGGLEDMRVRIFTTENGKKETYGYLGQDNRTTKTVRPYNPDNDMKLDNDHQNIKLTYGGDPVLYEAEEKDPNTVLKEDLESLGVLNNGDDNLTPVHVHIHKTFNIDDDEPKHVNDNDDTEIIDEKVEVEEPEEEVDLSNIKMGPKFEQTDYSHYDPDDDEKDENYYDNNNSHNYNNNNKYRNRDIPRKQKLRKNRNRNYDKF